MLIRKSQINSFKSRVRIIAQSYKIVYGCCHWRLIHTFRTNKLNANWFLDSSITRLKYSMPLVLMQWCTSKLEETQEKKKKKPSRSLFLAKKWQRYVAILDSNDFRFQQCYIIFFSCWNHILWLGQYHFFDY